MGGASRDSTGFGALEEGLISSRGRNRRVPLISDSDRRVPADWGQESQASSFGRIDAEAPILWPPDGKN